MSALSARTYSWGGDGARFFFGVGSFLTGLKKLSIGPRRAFAFRISSSVSIDSAEEREDKSETDMGAVRMVVSGEGR